MTYNLCCGVVVDEVLEEFVEGTLLSLGASVGCIAMWVKTSFIDDAKRAVVVVTRMDALNRLWQEWDDVAIATDVVVVATLAELFFTTGYQLFNAERVVAAVCHTVNDDKFYCFQLFHFDYIVFLIGLAEIAESAEIFISQT